VGHTNLTSLRHMHERGYVHCMGAWTWVWVWMYGRVGVGVGMGVSEWVAVCV